MRYLSLFVLIRFIGLGQAMALPFGLGSLIPTPDSIFQLGKNLLVGYPFEVVMTAVNTMCSTALSSGIIQPKIMPDINEMNFQLRTACKRLSFPLLKADEMWQSPDFDRNKKVVILATGWTSTVNETDISDALSKAYNCRGDVNFVVLDAGQYVDTLYTWSALNTEDIGLYLAHGLVRLVEIVPLENIHLIGFSLGAHIVGSAARNFNELTGKMIARVTGLDPARPCFNEGEVLSGLLRGYAEFIDVIHTNPGVLGIREAMGDVDFYPGGLDPLPNGCVTVICAHFRAWHYFAETVYPGNEHNFLGTRCNSLTKLQQKKCPGESYPMGYAVPHNIIGNYFLEVNANKPYGRNATALQNLAESSCGLCMQE